MENALGFAIAVLQVEPKSVQATMADREVEAVAAGGLRGVGAGSTLGRHGLDRALRFLPGASLISLHIAQTFDQDLSAIRLRDLPSQTASWCLICKSWIAHRNRHLYSH